MNRKLEMWSCPHDYGYCGARFPKTHENAIDNHILSSHPEVHAEMIARASAKLLGGANGDGTVYGSEEPSSAVLNDLVRSNEEWQRQQWKLLVDVSN